MSDEPLDIRARLGARLDLADPQNIDDLVAEVLSMEKGKWGVVDFTCKKCGHKAEYKAMVMVPDYKARADALKTLIDASDKPAKPVAETVNDDKIRELVREEIRAALTGD